MRNKKLKLISIIAVLVMLLTSFSGVFTASAYYYGQSVGIGTIKSASSRSLGTGITYDVATLTDNSSNSQSIKTITFNPATSGYMPLVYSKYSGYGDTAYNSCVSAESKYGYDVKGGVNASFFSFVGTCCNTYGGVNISDGKIIQGCNSNGATWMLAFNSNGTSALVYSRVVYALSVNGSLWSGALENINMYPYSTGTGIYYYDESCGNSTDTNTAGVEIVFTKTGNTELTVGGTLKGTVTAIRSSVSSGGTIGTGNFVLYASNSSSWASSLRALSVGSTVEIAVSETQSAAKTVMENCSSALVTYGYNIVSNGVNVTSSDGLGESFNTARAQRTAVGVKSDGTIVMLVADGRTTSYPGLTVYQVADFLISQGCVTGVNLDGGGSTQMTVENSSGTLATVYSSTRRVANCLLAVARPTISTSDRTTLSTLINNATYRLNTYSLSNETALNTALTYANGIYGSSKSMPGDYTKAIMRLQDAIAGGTVTGYKTGIYSFSASISLKASASSSATTNATVPAGTTLTITSTSGSWGYTKYKSYTGYVELSAAVRTGAISYTASSYTGNAEWYANSSYTASWSAMPGASGYTYKILQLDGDPNPGSSSESGTTLVYATSTRDTGYTIPASALTTGKYLKIAVGVEYPQGTLWTSTYITGSELPFTDVATTSWFYSSVKHVYQRGYFSGTSSTTFSPDNTMTRGMLSVVLYRMAGSPTVSGTLPFTDVASGAYYYNGILWCYQHGIVSGYDATTFGPDDNITREQAAVFLYRFANSQGYNTTVTDTTCLNGFADYTSVSSYAVTAMQWAVERGIMGGNGGYLYPKNSATRAQLATLIKNLDTVYGR